jgi:hypothetical protein
MHVFPTVVERCCFCLTTGIPPTGESNCGGNIVATTLANAQRKQAIKKSLAALIGDKEAKLAIKGQASLDATKASWI